MNDPHEPFVNDYIRGMEEYITKNIMSKERFRSWMEKMENLPTTKTSIDSRPNCFRQGESGGSCPFVHSSGDGYICCEYFPFTRMKLWINKNMIQKSHHQKPEFISLLDCCPVRQGQIFIEF